MKKVISVLILVSIISALTFTVCNSYSYTVTEKNKMVFLVGNTSCTLISGSECKGSVVIPNQVSSRPVTEIAEYAFSENKQITSITVPPSVKQVGNYAFSRCSNLSAVYIEDLQAWCGIKFTGAASNPLEYAHDLYVDGELLTDLVIPDTVVSVKESTFTDCSIKSVTIPESVHSIAAYAFGFCENIESVEIPKSVNSLSSRAFQYCYGLKNISVDADNENYTADNGIVYSKDKTKLIFCVNGKEDAVNIPDSVRSIEGGAFCGCKYVPEITLPEGIEAIESSTFSVCESLVSITVPDSVKKIDSFAFSECVKLENIVLPAEVTQLSGSAFYNCKSLKSITMPKIRILYAVCSGCESLESAVISGSEIIHSSAFAGCSALSEIKLPKELKYVYNDAFKGCENLSKVIYEGSKSQWQSIVIYEGNEALTAIKPTFLSFDNGDVNGDNEINNKDVILLFRYLSGDDENVILSSLDANGDGEVNNKDIVYLFSSLS